MLNCDDKLKELRDSIKQQRTPLPRPKEWDNVIVRKQDICWYQPEGTNPSRLGPVIDLPTKSFELFMQEIPPSGTSDMQRHHHESVHFVISGRGYSEIGEKKYDWAEGDFIFTPPMVWHRHYNLSETESVHMLLVENSKLLEALGLNYRVSAGLIKYEDLEE